MGSHIFFNRGEYAPTTSQGRELLAHELTHVVQQSYTSDVSNTQQRGEQPIQRASLAQHFAVNKDLWDQFGAPVWDWLKKVGGEAWQKIQEFATSVWEWTKPVRDLGEKAWNWIKNKLGIGDISSRVQAEKWLARI